MVVYTIWQCLHCGTTILMGPLDCSSDQKVYPPWGQWWPSPRNTVACCGEPNINRVRTTDDFNPTIELTDEKEAEPKRFDRVELVLQDMEAR